MAVSLPVILACLWALIGAAIALLPLRLQYAPGFALLLAAPVLILWAGWQHGPWVGVFLLAGFVSMFRRPLTHLCRRAFGLSVRRSEPDPEVRK